MYHGVNTFSRIGRLNSSCTIGPGMRCSMGSSRWFAEMMSRKVGITCWETVSATSSSG